MSFLQAGQTVLHYRIIEKIGKGGMGEVYKAEDLKLGRMVALKVLSEDSGEDKKSRRRFFQEARAASALNHPNIVTIHSIEETEGFDFIVMEYVEGQTLKSLIDKGPLDASIVADYGIQIAEALAAAHAAGFIHRDIKPANILVTPRGQAKILDFGLAKLMQIADENLSSEHTMSRLTKTGMILGTISYMSPEQTRGEPLDARTDIFSLGCVLYEAATGKAPFGGPSILSVLHEIATVEPPAPSAIRQAVPQGLDSIIRRALTKDRSERYSSAAELASALRRLTFANRYQILRELGRGGMGVVYLAHDPMLERDVAIKVISPDMLTGESVERFKREARVVAKMDHPGIVGIHDIGEHENSLFFVMPFAKGQNLRTFLKEGSLSLGDVIDIGVQVADALDYSHQQGVVHRDIKPENIMVFRQEGEGVRVRVTDFGLAVATTENRLTRTGSFVGTMAYLSPEQLSMKTVDGRSDIYSLGVVLYECITGQPPFTGEVQSVLYRIAHENPDSPRLRGAQVGEEFESILLQCLEKDPMKRPQRAKELSEVLIRHRASLRESDRVQKLSMIHKPASQTAKPPASALIGREKEFSELQRRLSAAALQAECQFAVIGGEAGIGKTRLIEELENIARAKNIRVLHSRFVEQDQAFPFQGFSEVIQEYFHLRMTGHSSGPVDFTDLAPDLVSLFPVLAEMNEVTGGQKLALTEGRKIQDRTYIYDLLARTLVRIGGNKPLLILFEELQNADVSLEALQYIVRRLGPTPTFIVGTYRSGEIDKHHPLTKLLNSFKGDRRFVSLMLEPLSAEEHEALLQSLIGSKNLERAFVDQLYESTEGNPHFAKELVRSLIDSGKIIQTSTGAWNLSGEAALSSDALPPTIQETVEKRIERLPEDWKEVLSTASVLGKAFDFRDLEILLEDKKDLDDVIDGLITSGFVEEERGSRGDLMTFSSGIVRDVLYAQVPRRRRRSLHRKYAEILESKHSGRLDQFYPQLVHHYQEGDVAEKVIEYGMELAKRSLNAFSAEDAMRSAKMVLDFVQEEKGKATPEEGEARSLLARACQMRGNTDGALQELDLAIGVYERCKDTTQVLQNVLLASEIAWEGRKVDETKHWVERGLQLARGDEQQTETFARLLSLAATVANLRGEYEKSKEYLEEAERLTPAKKEKEESIPQGGTLVVALPNPVAAYHPVKISIIEETEIFGNVFETLLTTDEQGHLLPLLCEEWKVSDQGKSFLFRIRPNVRMHDGDPLTAQRLKSSFQESIRVGHDRLPVAFEVISGVSKFLEGSADQVEGIEAQSEYEVRIHLQEPLPIYPALLTDPHAAVARESGTSNIIGTGPFRIESFESNSVVLKRNENYWKNPPALEAVKFQCGSSLANLASGLRTGEFDIVGSLPLQDLDQLLQDHHFRPNIVEAPKKNIYFALFQKESPLAKIPALRQAMGSIIRTDDLVRGTLGRFAQPAVGFLPPGILGHDPGKRQRQPISFDKARELLQSAGLQLPIRLKAIVHPVLQDRYSMLTNALIKGWAEIGVEVSFEKGGINDYLDNLINPEIDLMIGRYNADYDDPDNFTYFLFHSKAGLFKFYSSEDLDKLMEEARVESDVTNREKLYRKIENQLIENFYLLPLFHDVDYRVSSAKVVGLKLYSSPPYMKYAEIGKTETAARAVQRKTGGGILHVPLGTNLPGIDPRLTGTVQMAEVIPTIFETLTCQKEGATIVPWLVSEYRAEQGGSKFRFRLRKNVRFHDGRRLTSRDVRFSFESILQDPAALARWLLSSIRGAQAVMSGEKSELEGFRILSSTDFVVELDQPLAFFPVLLAHPGISIFPEGTKGFSGSWKEGCVGTGPFRVVRYEPGKRLELEPNPNYWRPAFPKSDGMVFLFGVPPQEILNGFRSGRFALAGDLFPADVEALRHDAEFAGFYRDTPRLSTHYVTFNIHRDPLSNEMFRHQLVQSVDTESLVRRHIGRLAIPAHSLIPPGLLGYEALQQRSRRLQTEKPKEPIPLVAMTHSLYDGPYASFAGELFESFERAGFPVRIEGSKVEITGYVDAAPKSDISLTRWVGDYPDADTFFYGLLHSQNGIHGSFSAIPEMDRLIERGRTETRPELRHEIYREAEHIIADRAILLPLFHEQTYRFARPEVQDFEVHFAPQSVPYEKLWIRK